MSKNRKSFFYIFQKNGKKISFRVYRIKQNIPVLIGHFSLPKKTAKDSKFRKNKRLVFKVCARMFLLRKKLILPTHVLGVDYLLDGV